MHDRRGGQSREPTRRPNVMARPWGRSIRAAAWLLALLAAVDAVAGQPNSTAISPSAPTLSGSIPRTVRVCSLIKGGASSTLRSCTLHPGTSPLVGPPPRATPTPLPLLQARG